MDKDEPNRQPEPPKDGDVESTASLLSLVRDGNEPARERLAARYLATLRRFAHGRLPARFRNLADTDDLVQVTVLKALERVKSFEPRRVGGFLAYMRRILLNQVRYEFRSASRRPAQMDVSDELPWVGPSPHELAIGSETLELYRQGLERLTPMQRKAVILRVEMGYTYAQLAEALGSPSANAARMNVERALTGLAKSMKEKN